MVLQLDNVDGAENFLEPWARHVEVVRRYSPAIERWRSEVEAQMPERLRRRSDAAQLVDKYLWTMSGENPAGDPTIFHDGGNGYGLMADRVSRTPPGSSPATQIRNAWTLVGNNPNKWTDWGEGATYKGRNFGALGVIAPYDPDPNAVHPSMGGVARISPPSVGEEGIASATTQPPGWEPPAGYASSSDIPLVEKLRIAREKRLRDTGYIPPEVPSVAGGVTGDILRTGQVSREAYDILQQRQQELSRLKGLAEDALGGTDAGLVEDIATSGLRAASSVFSGLGGVELPFPTMLPGPGGRRGSNATVGDAARAATTEIEALEPVQDAAGEAGRIVGDIAPYGLAATGFMAPLLYEKGLRRGARAVGVNLPSTGDIGEEAGRALVPTTPAEIGLELVPGVGTVPDLARLGRRGLDEAAVRLAANETFDRLAPARLLRHERAGAAIAQEAAGQAVDPRSPFARRTAAAAFGPSPSPLVWETRGAGARAGMAAGPEVAGGGAGRDAYGRMARKKYADALGEQQAARQEAMLQRAGKTWADYADATRAFEPSTPSWEVDPGSASIGQASRAVKPDGSIDYPQLTRELRQAVADVRAERIGQGTLDEMARASAAIRQEGARTGRAAGPEVGGGRAGPRGETARLQAARANVEHVVRNLTEMAREGEKGRFWYELNSEGFLRLTQHDVQKATEMAWIAAMGSPQTPVERQGEQLIKAWAQVIRGEPISAHRFGFYNERMRKIIEGSPEALDDFVVTLLKPELTAAEAKKLKAAGLTVDRGRKTANFFLDMLDGIDPERAARIRATSGRSGATIDLHMVRATFGHRGPQGDAISEREYDFIEDLVRQVGDNLGWSTKQAQAAIWVTDIYRDPLRKVSVEEAAQNYIDALKGHRAIVSWESAPGKGTPFSAKLPNFEHWSYAEQFEFHDAISKAFLDENGDNILAKALNIPGGMIHYGPGFYEGEVHPGAAFDVYLHPTMAKKMDELAALTGYALQQTAVPWTRPVYKANAGAHNGLVLDMGRPMTVEEGMGLQTTLGDGYVVTQGPENDIYVFRIMGDSDYAARDLPASAPEFKAMAEVNKKARQEILDALDQVWDNNLEVRHSPMATDGNYLENDWTVAPNGETYLAAAPSAQSPDVRASLGSLRARLQATVDEFALRHADDPPIGLRDPRFDYGELQPVTGLVARQRDVTRTRGAAWIDPQGQIWLNNAPEHVDAIVGGRQKGTMNAFTDVMGDGWVRVTSTKNPDAPTRQLSIHGYGDDNTRAGADALINSLPESARATTELVVSPWPDQHEYWMGNAQQWLDAGKPVRTPSPWDAPAGAAVPQSPDVSGARLEGARRGREAGAEVAGGNVGPGERPKTTWKITNAEGETREVELNAGPRSSSVEEAQATFARETARARRLGVQATNDRRVAQAQQAVEGVRRLRDEARQRVGLDPEKIIPTERLPTGQQYGWIDPDGNLSQLRFGVEHRDALAGRGGRELSPSEAFYDAQEAGYLRVGKAGGEVFVEGSYLPSRVADVRNFLEGEIGSDSSLRRVVIEDRISGERLKMPVREWLEENSPIPGVGRARLEGARQGRMFGEDVSGGRALGAAPVDVGVDRLRAGETDPRFDFSRMRPLDRPEQALRVGSAVWASPDGRLWQGGDSVTEHLDMLKDGEDAGNVLADGWVKVRLNRSGPGQASLYLTGEPMAVRSAGESIAERLPASVRNNLDVVVEGQGRMPAREWLAGDARLRGARQGRMFGGEVSGGFGVGRRPAATVPPEPRAPRQGVLEGFEPEEVLPERLSHWAKAWRELRGLAGAPRTLMTAGPWDASAIVRNVSILGARHPGAFGETVRETFKAYGSEEVARAAREGIEASPLYDDAVNKYGLKFWRWGQGVEASERAPGYEGLTDSVISSWLTKAPWIKGSERAMATAQNVMGMRTWEEWAPRILDNPSLSDAQKTRRLTDLASVINHSRGFSGSDAAAFLSKLNAFFSAQYTLSRPQLVADPLVMLLRGSPEAAQLAGQSLLAWGGGNALLLGLLGLSGAAAGGAWSVNANPLDSDFGQLKIGSTRYDTLAGLGPLMKLTARVGALGSDAGFGTDFARDRDAVGTLLKTYFENKEQPVARAITDFLQYNKLPDVKDLPTWFLPMLATGIAETVWNEDGLYKLQAIPAAVAGTVGVGTSTYKNAQDHADSIAQDTYGRKFDDLTRDERLGVIGNAPERERKSLTREEKKGYERDRNKAGYQEYWPDDRKRQFFREHSELEAQAWYFDRRTLQNVDTVDRVLALNIPDREVRYQGVPIDIARDEKTRRAWDASKDMLEEYTFTIIEKNREATAQRMYQKKWERLTDSQRSAVVGNIHDRLLASDGEMKAWMYWWGKTRSLKGQSSVDRFRALQRQYGPGADAMGVGGSIGKQLSTTAR